MTINQIELCEHCNKSSLSLLLLRPSPIVRSGPLTVPGSQTLQNVSGMLSSDVLPQRKPTESEPVLRLLRAGFVHVYAPDAPPPMKKWFVYQVTDNADLIPSTDHSFDPAKPPPACRVDGHNVAGRRLLTIPQAHKLDKIWIAYSANLWSDKLKAQNGANPNAMQPVYLKGRSPNTFKPTAALLTRYVMECAVAPLRVGTTGLAIDGVASVETLLQSYENEFEFHSMAGTEAVSALVRTMEVAAAAHPLTLGHEQAVVLRDPVGFTAELNVLRQKRFAMMKAESARPENAHPLSSIQMLEGLRKHVMDTNEARKLEAISPVMHRGMFDNIMRVKPNPRGWPEGTQWVAMSTREEIINHGPGMGRVVFPDHEVRAAQWARAQSDATYQRWRQYVDEAKITAWQKDFESTMRTRHTEPLERFEADWWCSRKETLFDNYVKFHFDENDPNLPRERHCPGVIYTAEVERALVPAPCVRGPVADEYLAEILRSPTDPDAVMPRALVANQGTLLAYLANYLSDERADKAHDLGSGLVTKAAERLSTADAKYAWLLHATYAAASLGISSAMSAALAGSSAMAQAASAGALAGPVLAQVNRITSLLMASKAVTLASASVIEGTALRRPLLLEIHVLPGEAARLLRGPVTHSALKTIHANKTPSGHIRLSLATELGDLPPSVRTAAEAIASGAGRLSIGSTAALLTAASIRVSPQQLDQMLAQLFEQRRMAAQAAAQTVRTMAVMGKAPKLALDGHIGLLAAMLNGWGLAKTINDPNFGNDPLLRANAFDSLFGVITGTALIFEAAASASVIHRVGQEAVAKSAWVLGARAVGAVAGAFGSGAMLMGQIIKFNRAAEQGNYGAVTLYGLSGLTVLGLTSAQGVLAAGAVADFLVARGAKKAVWMFAAHNIATRVAATRVAGLVVMGLSGWGLVFLSAGLVFEVWAWAVTPDELQKHVKRSRFGVGPDNYKTQAEEFAALDKLSPQSVIEDKPVGTQPASAAIN